MTGKAKNGKKFTGTYTIERFARSGGKQYAVGTLKGRLGGRRVTRKNVQIPVALERHQAAGASQLPNPTPGACQILDLVLQPIDLNLLGLRVRHEPDRGPDRGRPRRRGPARQPAVRDHRHPRPAGRVAPERVAAHAGPERAARAGAPHRVGSAQAAARPHSPSGRAAIFAGS